MSTSIDRLLSKDKYSNLERTSVTSSRAFYEASRVSPCLREEQPEQELSSFQDFKLDLFKHYLEEAGYAVSNLLEGYLALEHLERKAKLLLFYLKGIQRETRYDDREFQLLFNWFLDNDGPEEIRALIYFAAYFAETDALLLHFIMENLEQAGDDIRPFMTEALKWSDNSDIDDCLLQLTGRTDDRQLKEALKDLLRFRRATRYPVKIPFFYGNNPGLNDVGIS